MAQTDNPNRTASEVRFIFSRHNGALSGPNSAKFMFKWQNDAYISTMPLEINDPTVVDQVTELQSELENNEDVEDVYISAQLVGEIKEN